MPSVSKDICVWCFMLNVWCAVSKRCPVNLSSHEETNETSICLCNCPVYNCCIIRRTELFQDKYGVIVDHSSNPSTVFGFEGFGNERWSKRTSCLEICHGRNHAADNRAPSKSVCWHECTQYHVKTAYQEVHIHSLRTFRQLYGSWYMFYILCLGIIAPLRNSAENSVELGPCKWGNVKLRHSRS
jgi:hypothetical protein